MAHPVKMKFSFIGIAPLLGTVYMMNAQNVIMGAIMFGYLMIGMKFLVRNVLTHAKHVIRYTRNTHPERNKHVIQV